MWLETKYLVYWYSWALKITRSASRVRRCVTYCTSTGVCFLETFSERRCLAGGGRKFATLFTAESRGSMSAGQIAVFWGEAGLDRPLLDSPASLGGVLNDVFVLTGPGGDSDPDSMDESVGVSSILFPASQPGTASKVSDARVGSETVWIVIFKAVLKEEQSISSIGISAFSRWRISPSKQRLLASGFSSFSSSLDCSIISGISRAGTLWMRADSFSSALNSLLISGICAGVGIPSPDSSRLEIVGWHVLRLALGTRGLGHFRVMIGASASPRPACSVSSNLGIGPSSLTSEVVA